MSVVVFVLIELMVMIVLPGKVVFRGNFRVRICP